MMTGNCILVYLILFTANTHEQSTTDPISLTILIDGTTTPASAGDTTEIKVKLLDESSSGGTYSVGSSNEPGAGQETTMNENQSSTGGGVGESNDGSAVETASEITGTVTEIKSTTTFSGTGDTVGDQDTTSRPTSIKSTESINENEFSTTPKLMTMPTEVFASVGGDKIQSTTITSLEITTKRNDISSSTTVTSAKINIETKPITTEAVTPFEVVETSTKPTIVTQQTIHDIVVTPHNSPPINLVTTEMVFIPNAAPVLDNNFQEPQQNATSPPQHRETLMTGFDQPMSSPATPPKSSSGMQKENKDNAGSSHLPIPSLIVTLMVIICVNIVIQFNHHNGVGGYPL